MPILNARYAVSADHLNASALHARYAVYIPQLTDSHTSTVRLNAGASQVVRRSRYVLTGISTPSRLNASPSHDRFSPTSSVSTPAPSLGISMRSLPPFVPAVSHHLNGNASRPSHSPPPQRQPSKLPTPAPAVERAHLRHAPPGRTCTFVRCPLAHSRQCPLTHLRHAPSTSYPPTVSTPTLAVPICLTANASYTWITVQRQHHSSHLCR